MRHIDEIRVLLSDCSFDILAINETKLDHTILDCEIHINNYSIVCYNRNRYGGGVAIYVKNSILYKTLLNFPDLIGYLRSLFIICILYFSVFMKVIRTILLSYIFHITTVLRLAVVTCGWKKCKI